MNWRELLKVGKERLIRAEIEDADCDAWILLEYISGLDRARFFLYEQETVPTDVITKYTEMLEQRSCHIPVQHLTGSQEFMGLEFMVTPDVLIPRQDTELLVETVLPYVKGKKVLDVCTGSGCIAISLALLGQTSATDAVDISEKALKVAKINAGRLHAPVDFYQGDLLEDIKGTYDVIVSNPPYIASGELQKLMPEVHDHEPELALDGGTDGLDFYPRLLQEVTKHLAPGGIFAVEIGYDQGVAVREMFRRNHFEDVKCHQDLCGKDRVIIGRYQ
ncbi:MAG: peptide chain release factor N(5)-glutamine methyltransferase [Lachnospiraceae bacterium]|nr:peptide chain release factor N(5)-glutamine methyltransferase [Lachnospiraceae bacterium]